MSVSENLKTSVDLIDKIASDLQRLRALIGSKSGALDPKDPRNKRSDGKLTRRGEEVCYRLFDQGATRYAVKEALGLSFAAASYRFERWKMEGGSSREQKPLTE